MDGNTEITNICTANGDTLEWIFREGERTRLHAWRQDGQIYLKGIFNGEEVEKSKKIDDRPWYQSLSYSLRDFLGSPDQKISFWTIRANTLDIYALQAKKSQREKIETTFGPVMANQVVIQVEGILSGLWHATYWYRQEDGLFLRYQSVHGPVGTQETVVNIASDASPKTGRM